MPKGTVLLGVLQDVPPVSAIAVSKGRFLEEEILHEQWD